MALDINGSMLTLDYSFFSDGVSSDDHQSPTLYSFSNFSQIFLDFLLNPFFLLHQPPLHHLLLPFTLLVLYFNLNFSLSSILPL